MNSPQQRFLQDVLAAVASFERAMIVERTTRGRRKSIRDGGRPVTPPPLGWTWDRDLNKIVEEETEARTVWEAFRLLAEEHLAGGATVRRLRAGGFLSRERKTGERKNVAMRTLTGNRPD